MKQYRWFALLLVPVATVIFVFNVPCRPKPEMVRVLVVTREVRQGTYLKEPGQYVEQRTIAKHLVPDGALTELEDVRDKLAVNDLEAGQLVDRRNLADFESLRPVLRPGDRAVTLRVHVDRDTVNRALPGTYVDLHCKRELPDGQIEWTLLIEGALSLSV